MTQRATPAPGSFYQKMVSLCDLHHKAGQGVIISGRIGEGKTSLIRYLASRTEVDGRPIGGIVTVRLAGKSADAINGIPAKGTTQIGTDTFNTSAETTPEWALRVAELAVGQRIVYVYIQELNLAFPDALAAAQDMLLERVLPNGFQLPDSVRFVCDMNPRSEVTGTFDLSDALTNRVAVYNFEAPLEEWCRALVSGFPGEVPPSRVKLFYRSMVSAFISAQPHLVYESRAEVDRAEQAWASKRSWTSLCDTLTCAAEAADGAPSDETTAAIVNATVGSRAGTLFRAWLAGERIPTVQEMVSDPRCLDGLTDSALQAAVGVLVAQALAASVTSEGTVVASKIPDSPVSSAVGVLNHIRAAHPDIALTAVLQLIRDVGRQVHGIALLDPHQVEHGFVAPTHAVDTAFAASTDHLSRLFKGL